MDTPAHLFNRRLGQSLRKFRIGKPAQQEQVAAAARELGLKWDRSTVNAIERGVRQLLVYELVMLAAILRHAGITKNDGTEIQTSDILSDEVQVQFVGDLLKTRPAPTSVQAIAAEEVVQRTAPRYHVSP